MAARLLSLSEGAPEKLRSRQQPVPASLESKGYGAYCLPRNEWLNDKACKWVHSHVQIEHVLNNLRANWVFVISSWFFVPGKGFRKSLIPKEAETVWNQKVMATLRLDFGTWKQKTWSNVNELQLIYIYMYIYIYIYIVTYTCTCTCILYIHTYIYIYRTLASSWQN